MRQQRVDRLISYRVEDGNFAFLLNDVTGLLDATGVASLLEEDPDHILMSLVYYDGDGRTTGSIINTAGQLTFKPFRVDLNTGKSKELPTSSRSLAGIIYDGAGKELIELEWQMKAGRFEVFTMEGERRKIFSRQGIDMAPLSIEGLNAGHDAVIVDFDDAERDGLYEIEISTGEIKPFRIDGRIAGDPGLLHDKYDETIVGYYGSDDFTLAEYTDPELAAVSQQVQDALGISNIWLRSWTADRNKFTISATPPGRPTEFYLFDREKLALSPIGGVAPWLKDKPLGQVTRIEYPAADGLVIPAYLTLPVGRTEEDGPFKLVVLPHGGPEARDTADYDWLSQALAAAGYMVLQPNFRGSAGYGGEFRDRGYGEFGGKMVTDVSDGARYLVEQGLASDEGYCAVGASYGGYNALMLGLLEAGSTRCVVSINGVTDPFELAAEVPTGTPGVAYWQQYMTGPGSRLSAAERKAISPLDRAKEYKVPVLLLHGEEDSTVRFRHSQQFERAAGKTAKLVTLPGSDHYLGDTQTRRLVLENLLEFLNQNEPVE
nr:prolyl oligopeptidase family serine peptidase [uncultured Hyphomonas sp.]